MIDFDTPPINAVIEILLRGLKIDKLSEVKPRVLKSDDEKFLRTRRNAEVFSPRRVVKFMVDALDDGGQIDSRWLEIACGEAPFITNRYDAETGKDIPINQRVGILDRKLRNAKTLDEAKRAVQSVYGYDIQSDSLLIARANVLLSFVEYVENFNDSDLAEVAEVIAKNFWLMDALNIPSAQFNLFDDVPLCNIIDWTSGRKFIFGGSSMKKFDFVIGNPPYQDETSGDNKNYAPPVYNVLMEQAQKVGEKVALITPARFLFDAGGTPKDFNKKMLNDPHLKVLDYAPKADKYFKGVDIEGGVAITLRDETKNFGAIGTFITFDELRHVCEKVTTHQDFVEFGKIISGRTPYLFTDKLHEENLDAKTKLSDGHLYDISSNSFVALPEIFSLNKPNDANNFFRVLGRRNNERAYLWIQKKYVRGRVNEYIGKWKIFLSRANGASGKLGDEAARIISKPVIGEPSDVCTDTFIVVGAFDTRAEADACFKYVKSKFARALLGILKITQDNTADKWAKVPLQDFTAASDIKWTVSIADIDKQLYKKYGLDDAEINFIETHVKAMD